MPDSQRAKVQSQGFALGHITPPLTGLAPMHLRNSNLIKELMRQDTRLSQLSAMTCAPRLAGRLRLSPDSGGVAPGY